jgi:hypothetical protein
MTYNYMYTQIGSLCMTVVEHELKRHRALQDDVSKKKKEGLKLCS